MTKEEINKKLLESPNLKEDIDKLSAEELSGLDIKVYEQPIEGYYNAFDYMIRYNADDYMIESKDVRAGILNSSELSIVYPLMKRNKRFQSYISSETLMKTCPGTNKTMLEVLLEKEKPYLLAKDTVFEINDIEVAKKIIEKGYDELLDTADISLYNKKVNDEQTLLDYMLSKKIVPRVSYIRNPNANSHIDYSLNKLFLNMVKNRQNLLTKVGDRTLLERIIESGVEFVFDGYELEKVPLEEKQMISLICMKENRNDLLVQLRSVSSLIELSSHVDTQENDYNITEEDVASLSPALIDAIQEFSTLYSSDGQSDEGLIYTILEQTVDYAKTDPKMAYLDLCTLIDLKKHFNPNYKLVFDPNEGNYRRNDCISINNLKNSFVIAHEIGHEIHFYMNSGMVPSDIQNQLDIGRKIGLDKELMMKVYKRLIEESKELSENLDEEFRPKFESRLEEEYDGIDEYKRQVKEEFRETMSDPEDTLKYVERTYSKETTIALAEIIGRRSEESALEESLDEYASERIKVEYEMFKRNEFKVKQSAFMGYYNFIDAYYSGAIGDIYLKEYANSYGSTHSTEYYNTDMTQFTEMFANYVGLLKCPNGHKYIERLREEGFADILDKIDVFYRDSYYRNKGEYYYNVL